MNILTKDVKFLTKSVDDLQKDNWLLIQKDQSFDLKSKDGLLGTMFIKKEGGSGYVGTVIIDDYTYTFLPEKKFWPKEFIIINNDTKEQNILKFGIFGLSGKVSFNGRSYSFRGGAMGEGSSINWNWVESKNLHYLFLSATFMYPKNVFSIKEAEAISCPDAKILIFLARYLQMAYVIGW